MPRTQSRGLAGLTSNELYFYHAYCCPITSGPVRLEAAGDKSQWGAQLNIQLLGAFHTEKRVGPRPYCQMFTLKQMQTDIWTAVAKFQEGVWRS